MKMGEDEMVSMVQSVITMLVSGLPSTASMQKPRERSNLTRVMVTVL